MTIFDSIKDKLQNAIKTRNLVAANIYRVVIGECQAKNKFDDKFVTAYISSVVKSNQETISLGAPPDLAGKLVTENDYLKVFLPRVYTIQDVMDCGVLSELELTYNCPPEKAKGLVMQRLKANKIHINGNDLEALIALITKKE